MLASLLVTGLSSTQRDDLKGAIDSWFLKVMNLPGSEHRQTSTIGLKGETTGKNVEEYDINNQVGFRLEPEEQAGKHSLTITFFSEDLAVINKVLDLLIGQQIGTITQVTFNDELAQSIIDTRVVSLQKVQTSRLVVMIAKAEGICRDIVIPMSGDQESTALVYTLFRGQLRKMLAESN